MMSSLMVARLLGEARESGEGGRGKGEGHGKVKGRGIYLMPWFGDGKVL